MDQIFFQSLEKVALSNFSAVRGSYFDKPLSILTYLPLPGPGVYEHFFHQNQIHAHLCIDRTSITTIGDRDNPIWDSLNHEPLQIREIPFHTFFLNSLYRGLYKLNCLRLEWVKLGFYFLNCFITFSMHVPQFYLIQ